MKAAEIKEVLKLEAHPREGGFFRQTYKSQVSLHLARGARSVGTAIYYLLEPGTFSEMHKLSSDEIFHFYLGNPVEMLQLLPDGTTRVYVLGPDIAAGHHVQLQVSAGVWQGTRLLCKEGSTNEAFALLGCTVTPGFDYADYESGSYEELASRWPAETDRIRRLTR